MILYAVNQAMLLLLETLLKINVYSFSMKKSNNLITHFKLKWTVRKMNALWKKRRYLSRFHWQQKLSHVDDIFIFDDKYSCFVYLSREIFFFHAMFTYVVGGKENIMILFGAMSVMV